MSALLLSAVEKVPVNNTEFHCHTSLSAQFIDLGRLGGAQFCGGAAGAGAGAGANQPDYRSSPNSISH